MTIKRAGLPLQDAKELTMLVSSPAQAVADGKPAPTELAANADFLLETIVGDVHWTAMQIGALATALARARAGDANGLQAGRYLLHDDSKTMLLALRYGKFIGLDADVVARLIKAYREIGQAKLGLAPLIETARRGGAALPNLQRHCDAWRSIAAEAAVTLAELQRLTRTRLGPGYAADSEALSQFLVAAAKGTARETPRLQQRRRAPRVNVQGACTLLLPGGPTRATLEDISQRGLGVVCDAPLVEGQSLTAVMEDGRKLKAIVARRQGVHVGLQLAQPLSATDTLIRALVARN